MAKRSDSPHIRASYSGNLRDYNGTGAWSIAEVQARYRHYCDLLHIVDSRLPRVRESKDGDVTWVYPIMEDVIEGIERGDAACIALGIDFIEEDHHFIFGKTLKSNTARALRRADLTESQKERIRERVVKMLVSGTIPHEMREYAKLLRKVGVGRFWSRLERDISRENRFAMRFFEYLRTAECRPNETK
ncbi:MAG: hypothetical protein ACJ71S_16035 [Acidobacteriaceae bacterium]